ncbi:TetR/AcrR family transcriptional regulator [Flavobacterium commune]|uniref:TetR family transcriptional regulator n=1 Tax=Flavobacterium commune TaxID=1306519 RepID=A0A1D9PAR4_9FLAO|nr:TetR/AcrR family transcriptional regulator [Flavobacterium commune]AOZ99661.1 TetR family transcriptional regulator [Flavobacterium commune]
MDLLGNLKIKVNEKLYLKDPETSELGKKIILQSILLIDEIGLESFTFKKLGEQIQSNESSIYRYFENKHKLVVYLSSWYWSWMEYRLVLATNNINNPVEKLTKAIIVVTEKIKDDDNTKHINEAILNKIIIAEFNKALYTKEVDEDNKEGYFLVYKRIINQLATMIYDVNPDYPYSKSLASTIVEGSLHQHFLNEHLKTITDCSDLISPTDFYLDLITKALKK